MFGRKSAVQQVADELVEGVSHFRNAALASGQAANEAVSGARVALAKRRKGNQPDKASQKSSQKASKKAKQAGDSIAAAITPLVATIMAKAEDGGKAVDKQTRQLRREAQWRAKEVRRALRGERRRRWPFLAAAFAIGTTAGLLLGFLVGRRQNGMGEFNFQDAAQNAKDKLSSAASTVKEKASQTGSAIKDKTNDMGAATKNRMEQAGGSISSANNGVADSLQQTAARR